MSVGEHRHVFEPVLDSDEKLQWVGQPNTLCFVTSGLPVLVVGLLWGAMDYGFIQSSHAHGGPSPLGFEVPFFVMHSFPAWGSVLYMLWLTIAAGRTYYAFTDRRLMVRTGAIGTKLSVHDYDALSGLEVSIGPLERLFGVGTIRWDAPRRADGAATAGDLLRSRFRAIHRPYEVFKRIQSISLDVRADEQYPNALRPEKNPGYRTR